MKRHLYSLSKNVVSIKPLVFIASMLFAASSHAFTTSGTASTNALGGISGNDFYGSVDSASGTIANATSSYASYGGVLVADAVATSRALGSVSLAVSASSLVNFQQTADGVGSWNSSFVNTTGIGQDFYAQFSFDRNVSGSATNATGAFVPAYWPGNMDATYASTLNLNVIAGGGSSSYDAAALTLAGGRVPLGFLAPGTSIDLALGISGDVFALGGQTYVCSSVDPGPNDCDFFTGTASASAEGYLTLERISAVPVPPAVWLLGSGLAGLTMFGRRRARA